MQNFQFTVNGILSMPKESLDPSEKLVMIQFVNYKHLGVNEINQSLGYQQLGYSRQGWRKVTARLMDKGFIVGAKRRGYYKLNETNIF